MPLSQRGRHKPLISIDVPDLCHAIFSTTLDLVEEAFSRPPSSCVCNLELYQRKLLEDLSGRRVR